jgi:hypothetical protein
MNFATVIFNFILLIQGPCSGCASGGVPCAPCCATGCGPPPPPGLPIDGFVILLLVVGLVLGVYFRIKFLKSKKID